jgi:intracellular septation protein
MTLAVAVTFLICAAFFVSWLWRPRQAAEPGVWMLLIAYALLGAWALWFELYSASGQEPAGFMFWKPTIMYWTLSIILIVAPLLGWGYPVKAIFGTYFAFSNMEWRWMNRGLAALCALLGGVNLLVAFNTSEGNWVGYKYSAMINLLFLILLRMNFVWLPTVVNVAIKLYGRAIAFFQ